MKYNDTRQTYINKDNIQMEIKCPNCCSFDVELEEMDINTNKVKYYCNECEKTFEIEEDS